jgi:filamentous hemagglutinin family protein
MNHIRSPFWKDTFGTSVATTGLVVRTGQNSSMEMAGGLASQCPALKALGLCLLGAFGTMAHALPTSGVITAGSATISSNGASSLNINQTSQNATFNWQGFNVGAAESVKFVQPNSNSVAINRVQGSDPSRILGSLAANGKVFLVNPNGIWFGKDASVNVGGLVASTLDLTDSDFMAGQYRFDGSGKGEVSNLGTIRAEDGGYVVLLGNKVGNDGTITAKLGTVSLAAGSAMTMGVTADGLLHVTIDKATLNALASNGGLVRADGGVVFIAAQARDALLSTVVNNTGIVQANSVGYRNGRIVLDGGDAGVVNVGGALRASGHTPNTTGGTVIASGDKVVVNDHAQVDASGVAGGGGIYMGGGWQGNDPGIRQASGLYISPSATLDASATQNGNGGTVVAWSNTSVPHSTTRVYGSLSARGGVDGGDGGRIETSGHWIDVAGLRADAAAPRGKAGQWLLDPADLLVSGVPPGVPTDATFSPGSPATFTSGAATPNVLNTDIEAQLNAGTSVVLQTGPTGGGIGDILIGASITKAGGAGATLTLNAVGSIVFGPGIGITSLVGPLNVNLDSGSNILFNPGSNISSNGGNIAMTASAVFGIPPLVGTGLETLTMTILGATSIGLGLGAGAMSLPSGFATGFSAINILAGSGNVTVGGLMGFTDSVSIATSGNIIVDPLSAIATSKVGGVLALAGASFVNSAGAGAVTTFGGGGARWIIYSNDPSTNTFGGLSSGSQAIWGQSFISLAPGSVAPGNRYVFATPGAVVATTAGTVTKTYGQLVSLAGNVTYSGTPLTSAATYGNAYQDLAISDVLSVAPAITSIGAAAGATVAGSPYAVTAAGGLANSGYSIGYVNNGLLVVNKATLDVIALADSRTYNGQPYTGGNGIAYSGFLSGDTAAGLGGILV